MPCLVKEDARKFKEAIKSGRISPEQMLKATSKERQAILGKIIGEQNAGWVNAALEEKILLKDQNRGMVTWAKKVSGVTPEVRRDMLTTIQKNKRVFEPGTEDAFLESLAAKKLGAEITFDEAKTVSTLATNVETAKAKVAPNEPHGSPNRKAYGDAHFMLNDYVAGLKRHAGRVGNTIGGKALWYLKHPVESLFRSAGAAKSFLSTLDNSLYGRQGFKVWSNHPDVWWNAFRKSWVDITKELFGRDAMAAIKSEIYSRPNAMNGKYDDLGINIGTGPEEAFPSQVLTKIKIPFLSRLGRIPRHIAELPGRIPKAAESAFNGGALRFRADLADFHLREMGWQGLDVSDPAVGKPVGKMINSLTGRGNIGGLDAFGKYVNASIFSIKFLKSNFDFLTAHTLDRSMTPYVRKQAALNLVRSAATLANLYVIANLLKPGSVELDPRSSLFGKIKVGDTTFDPSGGMVGLVTLASRMLPTRHNGKWGLFRKTREGEIKELGTGDYGVKDSLDIFYDFWEGKLAPYAALFRDMWHATDYQGRKTHLPPGTVDIPGVGDVSRFVPTPRTIYEAHAPIPLQNFEETMTNPNAADALMTTILDGLGVGANTYTPPLHEKIKKQKKKGAFSIP